MLRIPPTDYMTPGQTYVGKLPGDTRPSFVRKRQPTICDAIGKVFTRCQRTPASNKMMSWSIRNFYPRVEYDCYPRKRKYWPRSPSYVVPHDIDVGRLATSVAQVCAACGKHRSPGWSSRHPLTPGGIAKPGLCKKCRDKSTSSEGSDHEGRGRRRRRRHHHHYDTSSEDEARYWRKKARRRYSHSWNRPYVRQRSSSHDSVNVCIENSPRFQNIHPIVSEPASDSVEEIQVRRRSLPPQRHSSYVIDSFDAGRARHHSLHDNVRSGRCVSLRHARPHSYRRHSNHVSFADTSDEIVSPLSRNPRRRHMYYDGANSGESEAYQRPQTPSIEEPESDIEEIKPGTKKITAMSTPSRSDVPKHLSFRERVIHQNQDPKRTTSAREGKVRGQISPNVSRSSSSDKSVRSLTPMHPDHPEHLIWLLSSHSLGSEKPPLSDLESLCGYDVPSDSSPPLSPIFDAGSYEKETLASSFQSSAGEDSGEPIEKFNDDEADFWVAQGRVHMNSLRKWQHKANAKGKARQDEWCHE